MRTPVVYTMGKVASSAITKAIRARGRVVHDIHTLNEEALKREALRALEKGKFPNPHICVSMAWKARDITVPQRCVYISLVRDPVARNISAYFQNREHYIDSLEKGEDTEAEALFEHFVETYPHTLPLRWYDREYKKHLGIDVFEGRFRHEKGFQLSHNNRVVIFRVDTPDDLKSQVLSNVLDFDVVVERANDSSNKDYKDDYRTVQSLARFTPEMIDPIYTSVFTRHFWSAEDIEAMRARWLKPLSQI